MGSSAASATCLRAILRLPGLQVVGLVTQPDRPAGRGRGLTPCPCKAYANERGITACISPESVNSPEAMSQVRAWKPDVVVVVAFGQFLKLPLLTLPPFGCINCHFSLLPKYRGAAPVQAALAAGDKMTGVSVIRMNIGMDDGRILLQAFEPIYADDTGESLMDRLAIAGGVTLAKALKLMAARALPPPVDQIEEEATFAHKFKKTDGLIDWAQPSAVIERRIRAYNPWPGSYTFLPNRLRRPGTTGRLVIEAAEFFKLDSAARSELPGTVIAVTNRGPVVRTADTALLLTALKPEGSRTMDGAAFLNGRPLKPLADMFATK